MCIPRMFNGRPFTSVCWAISPAVACMFAIDAGNTPKFAAAAAPNTSLFGDTITDVDGIAITNLGVLPASIANIQATAGLIAAQTDINGRPLNIRGIHIVAPPALEWDMRSYLTSSLQQWTEVGAGGGVPVPTTNIVPQMGFQLHIDPWLNQIDVSANVNTTWYMFADTGFGYAIGLDHLRGHEGPEICMKASNKVSLSGAPISPFDGDFESDDVMYRVRLCLGGNYMDPRCAYAQTGTG